MLYGGHYRCALTLIAKTWPIAMTLTTRLEDSTVQRLSFLILPCSIHTMVPFSEKALLLAPMVGITNRAFRTLLDELGGPDYAFTEMASAEAFIAHAQFEAFYTDAGPLPRSTSVQFYARSSEAMAAACSELLKRNAAEAPAGVDINFGCSAPHIRKTGGGSAWSADPAGAAAMVAAARAAWPGILSAKVRMGPDDDYDRFLDFCSNIAGAGLDFISVHPRTDGQRFRRKPRHDFTLRLASDLPIPVVANGDIVDADSAGRFLDGHGAEAAGTCAVMIGREAVRRPWIFRLLRAELRGAPPCPPVDRLAIGLRFIDLAESMLPAAWSLESSRRFFSYFCETMSFAHHIKYRLMNSPSLEAMRVNLATYFEEVPDDRIVDKA